MNDYSALRKQNNSTAAVLAVLLLCVVVSACMLFGRLMDYTSSDAVQYIPLTKSNGVTRVTTVESGDTAPLAPDHRVLMSPALLYSPGFRVTDENAVWQGETQVEIFRVNYDNASGEITVRSGRGDRLLAPGTGNVYEFALENTGNVSLDYAMSMEAYFSHGAFPIPVDARVTDYQGNYLAGSAEGMEDVLALNGVKQSGVIAAGNVYPYTLEWEWPFESGNDVYDTMLGDMATEEDIVLTIVIKTVASHSAIPDDPGGIPKTGDTNHIGLLAAVMILSLLGFLLILLQLRKGDGDEKA